MINLKDILIKH